MFISFSFLIFLVSAQPDIRALDGEFKIARFGACPGHCAHRGLSCLREECHKCSDCSFCGIFGGLTCPEATYSAPHRTKCLGTLDVLPPTADIPHETCGCLDSEVLPGQHYTCNPNKHQNPDRLLRTKNVNAAKLKPFEVVQFMRCPSTCFSYPVYCMKSKCSVCSECDACGAYAGLTCAPGVLTSDKKCRNNLMVMDVTETFPIRENPELRSPDPQTCGCKAGDSKAAFPANTCKPPKVQMSPPIWFSGTRRFPPPPPPPFKKPGSKPRSLLLDSPVESNHERVLEPLDDEEVPQFTKCVTSCADRPAYCTYAGLCEGCASCTLCGVVGGQPCPVGYLPNGSPCLNNLDIIPPSDLVDTYTCGCFAPSTASLSTDSCVAHPRHL